MHLPQRRDESLKGHTQRRVFNFKKLMAKTALHLAIKLDARGLLLDIAVSSETPRYFHGDPLLVEKILCTLVGHSMECLHDRGIITIRINTLDFNDQGNHRLQIAINESSHGMMPEEVYSINKCLQQQEWRDKEESISPLLRAASKWIKSLGGHLTIESAFGWGTRYIITLNMYIAGGEDSCSDAA